MAEVLIKLEHADNPANPNAWGRCHPVCVKPDGWAWGSAERPPKFCVIRVTDMTVAQVEPYLDTDMDSTDPLNPTQRAVRKWKFDIDDVTIPPVVRNRIANAISGGGVISVTKAQIVNFIKRNM
jgi:hypothetical protein